MKLIDGLDILFPRLDEEVFANCSLGRDGSVGGQTLNLHLAAN